MKIIKFTIMCFLLFYFTLNTQAQNWTSCSSSAALLDGAVDSVAYGDTLEAIPFTAFTAVAAPTSTLPHTHFLVVKKNSMASDLLGDKIIHTSLDGSFVPSNHGLFLGDTFSIVPISYNLWKLRVVMDAILQNTVPFLGTCCSIVSSQGVYSNSCDSLNNVGIYDSTDVNSVNEYIALYLFMTGNTSVSLRGLRNFYVDFNNDIATLSSLGCTGGETALCYAFDSIPSNHRHYSIYSGPPCLGVSTEFTHWADSIGFVHFTPQIIGGVAPYQYQWQFNNGTSNLQNPSCFYGSNGTYYPCLTVYDSNNCIFSYCDTIVITNLTTNYCNGISLDFGVLFDSAMSFNVLLYPILNNVPPNAQFSFAWTFGDGTGSFPGLPVHEYTSFGSFNLCITAFEASNNCVITYCDTITIDSFGNFGRSNTSTSFWVTTLPPEINYLITNTSKTTGIYSKVTLFPNPAKEILNLRMEDFEDSQDITIELISLLGNTLQVYTKRIQGFTTISLPVNELPQGAYFIRIVGDRIKEVHKFIKE